MQFSLTWLPDTLKAAGLPVVLADDGWTSRGVGDIGTVKGVMCHHTAGPRTGIMPSLRVVRDGREGLPGPLSQLCLGRNGTFYVVAAGRANHAGMGEWQGLTTGNSNFIGIEAENSGMPDDPWPDVQMTSYQKGVAAILKKIGAAPIMCCGHKEYAPHRKVDPSFDMKEFRDKVTEIMGGL